jgi:hypothetical protein
MLREEKTDSPDEGVDRLNQGDILRNVDFPLYSSVIGDEQKTATLSVVRFPRAVVLSQDCDIEQDQGIITGVKRGGSRLMSVLMAPLYEMNDAVGGNHLTELNMNAPSLPPATSGIGKQLRQNENPRYHCLPLSQARKDMPDLIADFKHYFAVSSDYLWAVRKDSRVASLNDLYREDLCQRFAAYLTRIGLPQAIRV